jgi:hypothetical protein
VLEDTCHASDLCAPATDFLSNRLPCPGHISYLPNRGPSLFQRQAEKLRRIFKEADRTRPLIEKVAQPSEVKDALTHPSSPLLPAHQDACVDARSSASACATSIPSMAAE